jgi:hypothetical protein
MAELGWDGAPAGGDHLEAVFAAFRSSPGLHRLKPPATRDALLKVEGSLGRELPATLRRLYEFSDGMELFDGNLRLLPAVGDGPLRLLDYSEWLREAEWPIPQEVLMFGGDGSDELFGLWYPPEFSPDGPTPVIEIGSIFEPGCMAVSSTNLPSFLRAWSGYFLAMLGAPEAALVAIGLPRPLWTVDARHHAVAIRPYLAWADPNLPHKTPDSYVDRLDVDGVRAMLAQARNT